MKKLLFFTSRLGGGGAEMHLLRLLNAFDRQRFGITLAVARPGGSYESMLAGDVDIERLSKTDLPSSTVSMIRAVGPLRRLIREIRPDAVIPVMGHAVASMAAALRGTSPEMRPKFIAVIQNNYSAQSRELALPLRLLHRRVRAAYEQADHVIALSHGVAEDLCQTIPACSGKTSVIPNAACDENVIVRSRDEIDFPRPPGKLLIACGRLTRQKGYPILLEAFREVQRRTAATLWILGDGPDKAALEDQVQASALCDSVRFLGFQNNPYAYFRLADIFVLSSLWEGFGNVVAEALACGTPVVASDCPYGPAEILAGGEFGRLVPVGDPHALAGAVIELLGDAQLCKSFSERGFRRARDFMASTIAGRYADAIEAVIDTPALGEKIPALSTSGRL